MKKFSVLLLSLFLMVFCVLPSFAVSASGDYVLVSGGASYKPSISPNSTYPDSGGELTDKNKGSLDPGEGHEDWKMCFGNPCYVGYKTDSVETLSIVIDLGKVVSNLTKFEVTSLQSLTGSIYHPNTMKVSVSEDNKNWADVGVTEAFTSKATTDELNTTTLKATYSFSARYVNILLTRRSDVSAQWIFLSDASVYTGGPDLPKYVAKPADTSSSGIASSTSTSGTSSSNSSSSSSVVSNNVSSNNASSKASTSITSKVTSSVDNTPSSNNNTIWYISIGVAIVAIAVVVVIVFNMKKKKKEQK